MNKQILVYTIVIFLLLIHETQAEEQQKCKTAKNVMDANPKDYSILNTLIAESRFINDDVYNILDDEQAVYTFFAPTNAAFRQVFKKYNFSLQDAIENPISSHIILGYHIAIGQILSEDQNIDSDQTFATYTPIGAKIRFDFSNGKKVLGVGSDASLEDSSIRVCEGVLQAINWILLPFEDTYMPDDDTDEGGV